MLLNLLTGWRIWQRTDHVRDVVVYWQAARHAGTDKLYRVPKGFGHTLALKLPYLYAPPFAALLKPFGNASFLSFARGMLIVSMLAFWLFAYCLSHLAGHPTLRGTLICGMILGIFPGVSEALALGQVDPILWALFGVGLITAYTPNWFLLAAIVKPFYFWPALTQRYHTWQIFQGFLLLAALFALGGMVCGWNTYAIWLREILPLVSQGTFASGNISLSFGALRLLQYAGIWHYTDGALPMFGHLWLTLASLCAPAIMWLLLRRQEPRLKAAAVMAAATLFAPICWITYLPVTLPLLVLLLRQFSPSYRDANATQLSIEKA